MTTNRWRRRARAKFRPGWRGAWPGMSAFAVPLGTRAAGAGRKGDHSLLKERIVSDIRIGISGWRYAPWRKDFYPAGLSQDRELAFASRTVSSIEINESFYALQTPELYRTWYGQTPDDFIFAVKAPRVITHVRRLAHVEQPLANFFASGVLYLGDKLGPILWQLPANLEYDAARFEAFLALLPHDGEAAHRCAQGCATHLKANVPAQPVSANRLRHAIEVLHESFLCEGLVALLRQYNVALVIADSAGKWPYCEDLTADFVYLRLHGDVELHSSGYTGTALRHWRKRIQAWSQGEQPEDAVCVSRQLPPSCTARDLYCYFDNDQKVHAPYDALRLLGKLGLDGEPVREPEVHV